MTKIILSKLDIKRDASEKLRKSRMLILWIFVFWLIALIGAVMSFWHFGMFYEGGLHSELFGVLCCLVFLFISSIIIIKYLYQFFLIKKGKFSIICEKLYSKNVEIVHIYKSSRFENVLYFKSGKIFVDENVYKKASVGDEFYLIMLDERLLFFVYNKKHYKLSD